MERNRHTLVTLGGGRCVKIGIKSSLDWIQAQPKWEIPVKETSVRDFFMKVFTQNAIRVLIISLSVLTVAASHAQEQDDPLNPEYEKLVEQLRDPSSTIRGRAYAKLIKLDLSARLEVTAASTDSNAQERDKPLNPEYEKLVEQLGDPSFAVRQQASAKLLEIGLSARAEVTAALNSPDLEIRLRARAFIEGFTPIGLGQYLLQNPGEITSLIPRHVRELLDRFPKDGTLNLQGLKSIDQGVARELAKFEGNGLALQGLESIDEDVARELAKFEGNCLYLQGLESIVEDVAQELASFKGDLLNKSPGWLRLEGLVAIDQDVARELAKFEGTYLALRGLKSIDKDMAREFTSYTGYLDLQGLKSIDKDAAKELAKFEGERLGLNGLESVDQDVARELASLQGALGLGGLKSMDKDVAKELAKFSGSGGLSLGLSLKSIDKDAARELAKWSGKYLNLQGLESIDKETARELAKFESHCLYLTGLTSIDKDTLEILKSNPAIRLPSK